MQRGTRAEHRHKMGSGIIGTAVTGILLAAAVILIIRKMIKDKKAGKSVSCGCGCGSCPNSEFCRKQHV